MVNEIIIEFPRFPEEIKLSNSRRSTYYKKKYHSRLPKKYRNEKYGYKNGILIDLETKTKVIKNKASVGKPRYHPISGNKIFAKLNEHIRNKIMVSLKSYFKNHIKKALPDGFLDLPLPVLMFMEMHTTPKFNNWDLSNMWIYTKSLEDAMVDEGLFPDDNIKYITLPAAPRFIPISNENKRKLVVRIVSDSDPRVINHVMYNLQPKSVLKLEKYEKGFGFDVIVTKEGKSGDIHIDTEAMKFYVNIGKIKINYSTLKKALGRIFSQCIQMNTAACFSIKLYRLYEKYIKTELLDKGIQVIAYGEEDGTQERK